MTPDVLNPRSPAAADWYAPDQKQPDNGCQFDGSTPVGALYDSRDFGEPIDAPAVQSPARELPEAEVMMARQSGGHGFGPDFEGERSEQ